MYGKMLFCFFNQPNLCACAWLSRCKEYNSVIVARTYECLPLAKGSCKCAVGMWLIAKGNPHCSDHADSQGREAWFQPRLKCFVELGPLVLPCSVTCKRVNKSSLLCPVGSLHSISPPNLSSGSCCYCKIQQVRPFCLQCCVSGFEDWLHSLPCTSLRVWGVVLLFTTSCRLSKYFKCRLSCEEHTMCLCLPD